MQARWRAKLRVDGFAKDATEEKKAFAQLAAAGGDLPILALGSGSDYSAFFQHLGITTLNIEYGNEADNRGIYHSMFDSFDHYVRFADPDFAYAVVEAQTVGRLILRVANADVLPLQLRDFADTVARYIREVRKLADDARAHANTLASLLDQNAFALAADPTRLVAPPAREAQVPNVNLAPLEHALERLQKSAQAYDAAYARAAATDLKLSAAQRRQLEALLRTLEQTLTQADGLPGRSWFRHMIYAPGLYTGYGAKTLPGVREAIEQRNWDEADRFAGIIATSLGAYCDQVDRATAVLTH